MGWRQKLHCCRYHQDFGSHWFVKYAVFKRSNLRNCVFCFDGAFDDADYCCCLLLVNSIERVDQQKTDNDVCDDIDL